MSLLKPTRWWLRPWCALRRHRMPDAPDWGWTYCKCRAFMRLWVTE